METRSRKIQKQQKMTRLGLSLDNIVHGKRNTRVPNRYGHEPKTYKDRFGNTHFNPGTSELTRKTIKFSGDSLKDIKKLVKQTGRGGRGSGEVWHHMSDLDSRTGKGTVILMPQNIHANQRHVGGSALARANIHDDPDKRSKYGVYK